MPECRVIRYIILNGACLDGHQRNYYTGQESQKGRENDQGNGLATRLGSRRETSVRWNAVGNHKYGLKAYRDLQRSQIIGARRPLEWPGSSARSGVASGETGDPLGCPKPTHFRRFVQCFYDLHSSNSLSIPISRQPLSRGCQVVL